MSNGIIFVSESKLARKKYSHRYGRKGCGYSSWWITIKAKFFHLSHDVVTCDVDPSHMTTSWDKQKNLAFTDRILSLLY